MCQVCFDGILMGFGGYCVYGDDVLCCKTATKIYVGVVPCYVVQSPMSPHCSLGLRTAGERRRVPVSSSPTKLSNRSFRSEQNASPKSPWPEIFSRSRKVKIS